MKLLCECIPEVLPSDQLRVTYSQYRLFQIVRWDV